MINDEVVFNHYKQALRSTLIQFFKAKDFLISHCFFLSLCNKVFCFISLHHVISKNANSWKFKKLKRARKVFLFGRHIGRKRDTALSVYIEGK